MSFDMGYRKEIYMFRIKCTESKSIYFIVGNTYCVKSGYLYSENGISTLKKFRSVTEINEFFTRIAKFELY